METKRYTYHIYGDFNSEVQEGSFELSSADGCFDVVTFTQGGTFNLWLDMVPTLIPLLNKIFLSKGSCFKCGLYYQVPLSQEKFTAALVEDMDRRGVARDDIGLGFTIGTCEESQ